MELLTEFYLSSAGVKTNTGQDWRLDYGDCQGRKHSEFDSHDLVIVTAGGSLAPPGDNSASGLTPTITVVQSSWTMEIYGSRVFLSLLHSGSGEWWW